MQTIDVIFGDQSLVSFVVHPHTTAGDVIMEIIKKSEEGSINIFSKNLTMNDICLMQNNSMLSANERLYSNENGSEKSKNIYFCFINPALDTKENIEYESDSIPLSTIIKLPNVNIVSKGEQLNNQNNDDAFDQQNTPFIFFILLLVFSYLIFT